MPELTPSEWASWVQATGTIVAVAAAAGIAIWQSRQQHNSALTLHKAEQKQARLAVAKSLLVIARNCSRAARHFASELDSREKIYNISTGETHFDFGELRHLRDATSGIPLYSLPDLLISHAMILAATIRQLDETVAILFREHRKWDAEQFARLFKTLSEMNESLQLTCRDIEAAVEDITSAA